MDWEAAGQVSRYFVSKIMCCGEDVVGAFWDGRGWCGVCIGFHLGFGGSCILALLVLVSFDGGHRFREVSGDGLTG